MSNTTSTHTIVVKTTAQGAQQTASAIRTVQMAADKLSRKVITVRVAANGTRTISTVTQQMKALDKEVKSTTASFSLFGRIVASVAIGASIQKLIGLTDTLTSLQSKLAVVDGGTGGVALAMERLVGVGDRARVGLESLITVYARTSRAMTGFGVSSLKVTQFTETLSKAVQLGGSTSVEASNAMIQLSQGMSSGTLRGDELRSVMEQLPVVAGLIAKEFGVTTGELKKLGAAGQLTTERVFNAIIKATTDVNKSFGSMRMTVAQAWEVFMNHATLAMERFQDSTGKIAQLLVDLANNFNLVIAAAQSLAQVIGIALAGKAVQSLIAAFRALIAVNPFLAILGAITLATAALGPFADQVRISKDGTATLADLWAVLVSRVQTFKIVSDGVNAPFVDLAKTLKSVVDYLLVIPSGLAAIWDISTNPVLLLKGALTAINETRELLGGPKSTSGDDFREDLNNTDMNNMFTGGRKDAHKFIDLETKKLQNAAEVESMVQAIAQNALLQKEADAKREAVERDEARVRNEKLTARTVAGKPTPGRSMEEILRELREGLRVMQELREHEMIVQKRIESEMDKLGKKQNSTLAQRNQLEELIRMQESVRIGKQLQKEEEDLINKALDERLAVELEILAAEQKISDELGKRVGKGRDDVAKQIAEDDEQIRKRLLTGKEEFAAERFKMQGFVGRNPDQFDKANAAFIQSMRGAQLVSEAFDGVAVSIADATANSIVFGESLSQSLNMIAKQLTASLISKLIQIGVGSGLGALGIGTAAPMIAKGLTPPTAVGSGASGGYFPGLRAGGFTGNGHRGDVAGVVHGREFVVNANATARNRATLESMNAGKAAGGMSVTIQNYGGVEVEARQLSPSDVEIMIKKGVAKQAPAAVAADMASGNSKMSKALKRHFGVNKSI